MSRVTLLLVVTLFLTSCASKFGKVLKSTDYEYKYKMAEQYYAQKKYQQAQTLFEDLFPVFKGTPRFDDLYYKFAYCSYYLKDYSSAENLFKTYVETFPNSPKAEEADYMRAYCFFKQSPKAELDQTNTVKAMGQMQAFINTHPNSAKIKEAAEIIDQSRAKIEVKDYKGAELYYNLGYYKAAAIAFTAIIDNFPDSERADEYKLMVIKSYYEYAKMSVEEKQPERFEKVVSESIDFHDRFPDSKYAKEVDTYKALSTNNKNKNKNEQIKEAGGF
jgi:outer membrane protein assembly factor BamD